MPRHETARKKTCVVALTGGIAAGKTLVSDTFAELGVPVVDTDVIAHRVVEPGQPALDEIKKAFGAAIIDGDGRLKRKDLRQLIFSDPSARKTLESILHPRIRADAAAAVAGVTADYCILVIPLLADRGVYPHVDRVLVVDVEPGTQLERLMARDNCSREQAQQALASQITREQRLQLADDVLDNSKDPSKTRAAVARLHQKYLQLAREQRGQART